MKLWLSKKSEVSLQEQLTAQLALGIASADLPVGSRLPSSSELARRFKVHPNTVRLAYRQLARDGWIEWKRGKGFFVRDCGREGNTSNDLDHLIATFLNAAHQLGHTQQGIRSRLQYWLSRKPPGRVLVIEPDAELRRILVREIQDSLPVPVQGVPALSKRHEYSGLLCAALHDPARKADTPLPATLRCVLLRSNSIPTALASEQRPPNDVMISVISTWAGFLSRARATLTAVGLDAAAIELRKGTTIDVKRRLNAGHLVVTDSLVGRRLSPHPRLRIFRILSGESLEELKNALD